MCIPLHLVRFPDLLGKFSVGNLTADPSPSPRALTVCFTFLSGGVSWVVGKCIFILARCYLVKKIPLVRITVHFSIES